jgi:hypothetical protein
VRLAPPHAEITPRAGKWLEADRLRSAVKNAGFKPGEIRYTIAGTLTGSQGQPALRLPDGERVVALQPDPSALETYERARRALPEAEGKPAEIEGRLLDRTHGKEKAPLDALCLLRLEIGGA